MLLTARPVSTLFAPALAGAISSFSALFSLPMKQKLFALSAGALLFAGSVLAAGTAPHAGTAHKPAARKSCPITKDCPASVCQSVSKAPKTCMPRPGCCMK